MSIISGDTGKVAVGSTKIFSLQLATPRERNMVTENGGTAIILPTTEPSTNVISFTVQASDLPMITPSPYSQRYCAVVYASGLCPATAPTLSYRTYYGTGGNPVSLTSGTNPLTNGHTANQYWTHCLWRFYNINVGDVLEVRYWSNQTNTTLDYCAIQIYPCNVLFTRPFVTLKDYTWTAQNATNSPNLTGAGVRPTLVNNTDNMIIPIYNPSNAGYGNTNGGWAIQATTALTIPYTFSSPYGSYRLNGKGDSSVVSTTANNSTTSIFYQKNSIPATISFREMLR